MMKYISIIILFFFISCTKQQETFLSNSSSNEITLEEKNKAMLNTVAIGLLESIQKENFRNQVHEKVLEAFDDDFNVLLKHLEEEKDLTKKIKSSIITYANELQKK